jgi:hypothetical protein
MRGRERGRVTEGDRGSGIDRRDDSQRSRACIYTGYSTAGAMGIIFGLSCHGLGQYIHDDAGAVCTWTMPTTTRYSSAPPQQLLDRPLSCPKAASVRQPRQASA